MVRDEIDQDVRNLTRNTIIPTLCLLGQTQASPVASCNALSANCPSDYYWITSSSGTVVQVYCEMNNVCGCSSTGGWTRVANLNMSNPSEQCPGEWILQTYSSEPRRLCRRGSSAGCLSTVYSTYGISYSHVCGKAIGYQYATVDAFAQFAGSQTIDGPYVDGVSLTHGSPGTRQHIWTFVAGNTERTGGASCPCAGGPAAPSFVGNDYFCESGNTLGAAVAVFYASDPLWDGEGCVTPPCCELTSPPGVTAPWFCKQLPQATTDDIEVRICADEPTTAEDTQVELIELYIR